MFDSERVSEWHGQDVVDPDGDRVGRLEEVYRDNYGDSAGFACVKTGLFGRRLTFVPLEGASIEPDHVRLAYPVDQIRQAPSVEPDGALTTEEEAALFEHYSLNSSLDPEAQFAAEGVPSEPSPQLSPGLAPGPPRLVRQYTPAEAADVANARRLIDEDELHRDRFPDLPGGDGTIDVDRLIALEERVAELEAWRGRSA